MWVCVHPRARRAGRKVSNLGMAQFMDSIRHLAPLVLLFVLSWLFVDFAISRLGGWAKLAVHYETDAPFPSRIFRFQGCQMRRTAQYNGCVNVGASQYGLYLALLPFFRTFHRKLLIPWHEITVTRGQSWLGPWTELRFRQAPGIWMRFFGKLPAELEKAAGSSWPATSSAAQTWTGAAKTT